MSSLLERVGELETLLDEAKQDLDMAHASLQEAQDELVATTRQLEIAMSRIEALESQLLIAGADAPESVQVH